MNISLGFSPCPNDTFIFEALAEKSIDTGGLDFDIHMEDVETLNRWGLEQKLQVTKFSYGVLESIRGYYRVLNTGSALGTGVGPLLIAHPDLQFKKPEHQCIALPGLHTSAHYLFNRAYPEAKDKVFLRYDEIEEFALAKKGLGVIIHENRFTYAGKGLVKLADLGALWEQKTALPVPLGGIAVRRDVEPELAKKLERLIAESIRHARSRINPITPYIAGHAQEMQEAVMLQHINLYVNDYSLALGSKGKAAVYEMLKQHQLTKSEQEDIFL